NGEPISAIVRSLDIVPQQFPGHVRALEFVELVVRRLARQKNEIGFGCKLCELSEQREHKDFRPSVCRARKQWRQVDRDGPPIIHQSTGLSNLAACKTPSAIG